MTGPDPTVARAAEVADRLVRLRALMGRRGVTAALLTTRRNFAWLTAGGTGHVLQSSETSVVGLLVTQAKIVAITQNLEARRTVDEELGGLGIEVAPVPWWVPGAVEAETFRRLPAGTTPTRDADLEPDLIGVRSRLSVFDQDRLESLGRVARDAVESALDAVVPGSTEDDLAAAVLGRLTGVRAPVVLVAADERIARYRHPLPGATVVRGRVMLVVVVERWGLHVAVTRIRELEPPTAELARRIEAVTAVEATMHAATRPGSTFGDVFEAATNAYAAAAFAGEWRNHHQGGSIGYQARERIAIPGDPTVIEAGMAFAWNPSIAGAKAEDTILIGVGVPRIVTG